MRILFITYEFPPIGGGGGRAAWQIARRLVRRGHDVKILTSLLASLAESEEREGVAIRRIRVRRKRAEECPPRELLSFMRRSMPAASRMARQFGPDVTCAFFGIPGGPAAWWVRRRLGIPYVLSLRGSDVPRAELARHQRLHLITRPVLRGVYRAAGAIVSVSGALRDAALKVEPNVAIEVISNGVDTSRFSPGARKSLGSVPELLFVGRLREFKGVQHAIRALPEIERQIGGKVRLTIAGDGPYRSTLEVLADQVSSDVRFTGWLDEEALVGAYQSASLILLPSLVEGHPNVLLEGMATGLPCVATDAPGTREVVNDDVGRLVPPENPQAIAQAVAELLGNEDRYESMSRHARAHAESFSWDKVSAQYEDLLQRTANG